MWMSAKNNSLHSSRKGESEWTSEKESKVFITIILPIFSILKLLIINQWPSEEGKKSKREREKKTCLSWMKKNNWWEGGWERGK